ncbi:DNA methyltransferase [Acrocarpospora sp. B8E8]|uniref:DNA methyltransferase n=1 Tax=Acrocarpospora sp. B8E8 TaxID=3153572 RepID=UPI00325F0A7A
MKTCVVREADEGAGDGQCHRHRNDLSPGALDFSAAGHLYATHQLHAFAARLPPPLAEWAINTFTDPGDHVLDVMCGSGTTLVEAVLTGRIGHGVDIDPLARLIAMAKATPITPEDVLTLIARIEEAFEGDLDDSWRPDLPRLDYWFRSDVSADLARIKSAILATTSDDAVRRLAWVVFSSLIVARTSVANAKDLVHSRHHYEQRKENPDTVARFMRQLRRAARLMDEFGKRLDGVDWHHARLAGNDARAMSVGSELMDLVFFSPPYVSALDYPRAHVFAVAWLADVLSTSVNQYRAHARDYVGTDRAPLAEATAGQPMPPASGYTVVDEVVQDLAESPAKAWVVYRYFRDMTHVLSECARVTRPGGHVVVVVCPSNIRRIHVPTHQIFAAIAPQLSDGLLEAEVVYERTIHDRRRVMPYLEKAFGERMRTEYVVVLRRTPRRTLGRPE